MLEYEELPVIVTEEFWFTPGSISAFVRKNCDICFFSTEVFLVTGHLRVYYQEVKHKGSLVGGGNNAIPNPIFDLT